MENEKLKHRETVALPTGHIVFAGQLVEVWRENSTAPFHAVIVDWSDSGKTITLHKCGVRAGQNGRDQIKLHKTDGTTARPVIQKFSLRAGRKGAPVAYRKGTQTVFFDLGS